MININCPAKDKWKEIERLVASIRAQLDEIDKKVRENDERTNPN
jgi:hypothetical protein